VKRLAAVVVVACAALGFTVPAASAASVCVHASVNVNGTSQTVDRCLP
jgi:hypothetical protein